MKREKLPKLPTMVMLEDSRAQESDARDSFASLIGYSMAHLGLAIFGQTILFSYAEGWSPPLCFEFVGASVASVFVIASGRIVERVSEKRWRLRYLLDHLIPLSAWVCGLVLSGVFFVMDLSPSTSWSAFLITVIWIAATVLLLSAILRQEIVIYRAKRQLDLAAKAYDDELQRLMDRLTYENVS